MGLHDYLRKRTFEKTPEPKGRIEQHGEKLRFVVQEHDARRLHYDFRLEMDGVLKSWAVPKGPSLNPHDHHLAVQTEDHPMSYRQFEGSIPKGNYGAGNVIVWDEGWYEARMGEPAQNETTLKKELKAGHITFILHGKKLKGEFALIRMNNADDKKSWLLVKKDDAYASARDVTWENESVKTQRTIETVGVPNIDITSYPKSKQPWRVQPMLSTSIDAPFDRENWLFEIKWDGYRAIASKYKDSIELYSRNHNDFSRYKPIVEALDTLSHDVILDGEITVVDPGGISRFEWLQNWEKTSPGRLQYQVFDIVWCDGHDLRTMPLRDRKALLQSIVPRSEIIKYSDHVENRGQSLFKEMQHRNLEGMIAKQADSRYQEGVRGEAWLKIKTHFRQEVVIGGYTEPRASRKFFGSLLVGVFKADKLHYVGHSGGGIADKQRQFLLEALKKRERKSSPFAKEPKPNAPVHWVKPELVCEMSFTQWTEDGLMRHPKFEGMRDDKKPQAVHQEHIEPTKKVLATGRTGLPFEVTHHDKVFFPKHRYTKGDLIAYYEKIAPFILPYIKDRPLSLNRMPHGINGESFYQKNHEHLPDWVPRANIFSESNNEDLHWMVGKDLATLLYTVQLGAVEVNPWNSRVGQLDTPDWAVIDLDPEGIGFEKVIEVALTVKQVCDELKIPAYPKTSGKTGIHIYIPLGAAYTFEQARNFTHLIVMEVNKRQPSITSLVRNPEKRKRRIYLDYLQNRQGQTLAAPYSVRPTPNATVSMPLHWEEVRPGLTPTKFTIKNALTRVQHDGDVWKPVLKKGVDILKVIERLSEND